ncbi:hypothetical protein [Pseudomonas sp. S60]|uniref:hypothetical protein n=1 Tax=Pseudomonas sp. S60 TaxID=211124 RepID=UPI001913401E|nr:hypothetical protein [Pseudomonas sp. S60]
MGFETWPFATKLIFLLTPFFIAVTGLAITCRIALSKDFDLAMSSVKSNRYLEAMKVAWGMKQLKCRFLLLGAVAGLLESATLQVKWGLLDPNEISRFPPVLKSRILLASRLEMVAGCWLMAAYFLIK